MPSLESMVMIHAGLVMDLFAIDAAAMGGDYDEARFLAMAVATNADDAGLEAVAAAAARLVIAFGPSGHCPGRAYTSCLIELESAIEVADPGQLRR